MKRLTTFFFLTVMFLLVWGCGRKAPPVPWGAVVPRRIVDLSAVSREGRILLEWTVPKENTDRTALVGLAAFQIFGSEGDLPGEECKGCGEKQKLIHEVKVKREEELKGKKMSLVMEDLEPGKTYAYSVISLNQRGDPSSPSNSVQVFWDIPPRPPQKVAAESGDKRVELAWEPVEGASGYNVYRKGQSGVFPTQPSNPELLKEARYVDLNVENERTYIYAIRALRRVVKTEVEGRGSLEVQAAPIDLIPPSSPVGLVAISLKEGMELNWRRNQEPDLGGYWVYRKKAGEENLSRLTAQPVTRETYLNKEVDVGQEYVYVVTAVDHSPRRNESPPSEEVRVRHLY